MKPSRTHHARERNPPRHPPVTAVTHGNKRAGRAVTRAVTSVTNRSRHAIGPL
jgi:hypothetical protein